MYQWFKFHKKLGRVTMNRSIYHWAFFPWKQGITIIVVYGFMAKLIAWRRWDDTAVREIMLAGILWPRILKSSFVCCKFNSFHETKMKITMLCILFVCWAFAFSINSRKTARQYIFFPFYPFNPLFKYCLWSQKL